MIKGHYLVVQDTICVPILVKNFMLTFVYKPFLHAETFFVVHTIYFIFKKFEMLSNYDHTIMQEI